MKDDNNNRFKLVAVAVIICAALGYFLYASNVFTYSDTENLISKMILKGN